MGRYLYDCGCVEIDGDILFCKTHRGEKPVPKATTVCDGGHLCKCVVKMYRQERDDLRAEVERLKALIERHRSMVWGLHKVEHPEDTELYDAAGRGEGE